MLSFTLPGLGVAIAEKDMSAADLERVGGIQLVSYDNQPNDMATLSAARRAGMDYLLQGHILNDDLDTPPPDPKKKPRFRIFKPKEKVQSLSVHWVVTDVNSGQRVQEQTLAMDRLQAEKQFPDCLPLSFDRGYRRGKPASCPTTAEIRVES